MRNFRTAAITLGLLALPLTAFADKVKFVVVPTVTHPGDRVSIVAVTTPNSKATLDLTGPGRHRADYRGLGSGTANDKGKVEWVFVVPNKAEVGSYMAIVHQGRDAQTRKFSIAK